MVEARFSDILTDFTCSALFTEMTKFFLYSKQQIPFSYDKLLYAVSRKRRQQEEASYQRFNPSERLFKVAKKGVDTLEEIFEKTCKEFSNSNGTVVEVAFLFGGSILTPKQVYRLHLPNLEIGHVPKYHSGQAVMSEVLKSIVKCDELHKMLNKPLEPTNLFLLLRVNGSPNSEPWLIPKPRYNIPAFGQQIHFNFLFESPDRIPCSCKGFQFFSDSLEDISNVPFAESTNSSRSRMSSEAWYQVPIVFKGFKDTYVKGISVSKYWFSVKNEDFDGES